MGCRRARLRLRPDWGTTLRRIRSQLRRLRTSSDQGSPIGRPSPLRLPPRRSGFRSRRRRIVPLTTTRTITTTKNITAVPTPTTITTTIPLLPPRNPKHPQPPGLHEPASLAITSIDSSRTRRPSPFLPVLLERIDLQRTTTTTKERRSSRRLRRRGEGTRLIHPWRRSRCFQGRRRWIIPRG